MEDSFREGYVMRRMSETRRRKKNKVSKKNHSLNHSTHTDPPNSYRQKENEEKEKEKGTLKNRAII